ncbi:MAG: hypothetical protein L6Q94_19385 [Calditrichia bacterium]|nr:hypothetical protein [Calditrichia bacterium]
MHLFRKLRLQKLVLPLVGENFSRDWIEKLAVESGLSVFPYTSRKLAVAKFSFSKISKVGGIAQNAKPLFIFIKTVHPKAVVAPNHT